MSVAIARDLIVCDFDTYVGLAVTWVRRFPLAASLLLWGASYATGQPILSFLGWCISFTIACMWPLKSYFDVRRYDPFCPSIWTWGFPVDELVYAGILLVFVIGYTNLWKHPRSWFQWFAIIVFGFGPVVFLVWYDRMWWGYLVVSALIGGLSAGLFLWWLWTHESVFVFLFVIWPFSIWYTDTVLIRNAAAAQKAVVVRTMFEKRDREALEKKVPLNQRRSSFYFFV